MKLGIMQPYFFPYLGYWQLIKAVDKYIVYDDVNFIKGGWISRNNILLNNQSHLITLPLDKPSPYKLINEIAITSDKVAIGKVVKKLEAAYAKAPYYNMVMPMISDLINESKTISELNYRTIIEIFRYLDIDTEVILSSSINKDNSLKGQDKVIHINNLMGSSEYINAIGGMELYDRDTFEKNGISIKFLKKGNTIYKQFNDSFVDNLSIIDVLMFNSIEETNRLLDDYSLV